MTRRTRRDQELERVSQAVRCSGGRSALYWWLHDRHDRLAGLLAVHRPDWRALAAELSALGLTNGAGEPIRPETARHTWWRVRRDVAKARRRRAPAGPPVVPVVLTPPEEQHPPTSGPAADPAGDVRARLWTEMLQRSGRG